MTPANIHPATRPFFLSRKKPFLTRGHALSYAGLFAFTTILCLRPAEWSPSLAFAARFGIVFALFTLVTFAITQFKLEKRLTARPPEVNLVLLLSLAGLISMPLALWPRQAWDEWNDVFIKAVLMFIVMVNVVRSEKRLQRLLLLGITVGCVLSFSALNAFRLGEFTDEGYRVRGTLGANFSDPNDMALYLVMMLPIAIALLLSADHAVKKAFFGLCALIMIGGIMVSYSRGGFLALIFAGAILSWKLGRHNRPRMAVIMLLAIAGFFALAPANYVGRVASIFDTKRDNGSANERRTILVRSVEVALDNPLLGIGMGNFPTLSVRDLVSHNSYTQVAAEMGFPALVIYLMFIITPWRALTRIERETFGVHRLARTHYLAVGLQASLAGYMVGSFFLSVAYYWYLYYLVGYAVCLRRIYETGPGHIVGRVAVPVESVKNELALR